MIRQTASTWDKVEARWAPLIGGAPVSFIGLIQEMEAFLTSQGVVTRAFSHFGIVVGNMETSPRELTEFSGIDLRQAKKVWVES